MLRKYRRLAKLFAYFALALTAAISPARAAWHEASSDHFVIYADDSEKDIRRFAENLERYHSAMEYILGRQVEKPSPSNRVTIFVVGSGREVRKIAGPNARNIAGFYIPRAGGSRAFVQDIRNKNGYPHFSTIVLMHEYAHHFLMSSSRFALPRWMNEGAAEFFAASSFEKDGSVFLGRPAQHRGAELFYAADVPIEPLLDYQLYRENKGRRYDAFYGRSWLLYHYLTFNEERFGSLTQYTKHLFSGMSSLEAAEAAFGDLNQLEKELKAYQRTRNWKAFTLGPDKLRVSEITLRRLPEGEAAMMKVRMKSQRGVTRAQAIDLIEDARKVAAKFPNDAGVLSALAEAEHDAGNDDAAIAAADKAIAIDPTRTNAYVQKGYALFRKAREAEDKEAAYDKAMRPFSALNQIENDHPLPLIYYYRSYAERGEEPPENARHALERAAQLAPFDKEIWFQVAVMQMQEGKIELAKNALKPLANDPHGAGRADRMRELIAVLETLPEGKPVNMRRLRDTVRGKGQSSAARDESANEDE